MVNFGIYPKIFSVLAVLIGLAYAHYKIDLRGYDRCQQEHQNAIVKMREVSREKIIEVDKKHEKINAEIRKHKSFTGVGPAVTTAIDSMPDAPSGDSK